MLFLTTLISALVFAAVYPLCFWISFKDPLKGDFHKFHIGLPNFVGGVAVVVLFFSGIPLWIKIAAMIWKGTFLWISYYYWKKGGIPHQVITIPCVMGLLVFCFIFHELVIRPLLAQGFILSSMTVPLLVAAILGGFIFCSALYA